MMVTSEQIVSQTQKWISDVVIGCNFCPFAARELKRGTIHYQVETSALPEACLEAFLLECRRLDEDPAIETTLLIFPNAYMDFDEYLNLVEMAEQLLETADYAGVYQVAGFHPDYRFADAPADDPANYTNRSLYPMLHLLREESMDQALAKYLDPESIPERNVAFARNKGLVYMKTLRDACS
jgi:uncharacterized protein